MPGTVLLDEELCPRRVARDSEFFADWIRPQRIGESALFATIFQEQSSVGVLILARDRHDRYEERDRQLVGLLRPLVQQAFELRRRFVALESATFAAGSALDCWTIGVIILDAKGSVVVTNRSARAILDRKCGY